MIKDHISYIKTGRFSKIIIDYLSKNENLKPFYSKFPLKNNLKLQAEKKIKNFSESNRKILLDNLKNQYKGVKISKEVKNNLKLLSESNSVTITTGHQLSLMTGPLYFIIKIISTINLCKKLNSLFPEINFIPVYWMASEDHDFQEICSFNYKLEEIKWKTNQKGSAGKMDLNELELALNYFEKKLTNSKNSEEIKKLINLSYRSSKNLAEATRKIVNSLFSQYGLIIVDGNTHSLKKLFIEHMKSEIIKNNCHDLVIDQISSLKNKYNSKFKPQVNPRLINLFYLTENERYRIEKEKNIYYLKGSDKKFSKSELINEIENFPENFSPNVLTRPLYQEVILPNIAYVGGGGELSYWFQLSKYFDHEKVMFPILILRNSVLLINSKLSKKLKNLKINTKDLFLDKNILVSKIIKEHSEINLDLQFLKNQLNSQFNFLESLIKKTDKSFIGAVNAQKKKQLKGILNLEKKLLKSQKRKMNDLVNRINILHENIFPNNDLQERQVNFFEFYEEFGFSILSFLLENLDPFENKFTVFNN